MALVMLLTVARILKWMFLGALRPAEIERVNEQVKFMLLETLVALTVFREELTMHTTALFALLLFNKFFHLVTERRVDVVRSLLIGCFGCRCVCVRVVVLLLS